MDMSLPDEILDIPHKDGPQTEVDYRAGWARTSLKRIGCDRQHGEGGVDHHRQRTGRSERGAGSVNWCEVIGADRQQTKRARDTKAPEPETADRTNDQGWEDALSRYSSKHRA